MVTKLKDLWYNRFRVCETAKELQQTKVRKRDEKHKIHHMPVYGRQYSFIGMRTGGKSAGYEGLQSGLC